LKVLTGVKQIVNGILFNVILMTSG